MNNRRIPSLVNIGKLWCLLAALCAASNCSAQDKRGVESGGNLNYELNSKASIVSHSIDATQKPPAKFVRITLGAIVNPTRASLSFEVSFRPARGESVPLGVFSPFPADNPGSFIVPTQGKVVGNGTLDVSMKGADSAAVSALSVRIKSIELVDN